MKKESLKVLNLKYQRLAELNDNSELCAREISCTTKVNEIASLSFKLPATNPKITYLLNEYLIEFKDEYYVIKIPTVERNEDGQIFYSYTCSHLSNTLQTNTLTLGEITPRNPTELMKLALLYEGNTPTLGWSVGTVEADASVLRGLDVSEQSSFAILCSIADKYNCMLKFRSKEKKVDLLHLDDTIKPKLHLTLRKNLKGLNIKYDSSEMITRMYCFGCEDNNGNEITIQTVNPTKQAYIENYSYYTSLGYTQEDIKSNPELFVKTNIWRDTNYTDPQDLYDDGVKKLQSLCVPKIEVSVTALDTTLLDNDYKQILRLHIGDVIIIDDQELGIKFRCYIIEKKENEDEPYVLNITLTNEIDYRNVLSDLFSTVSTVSQVVTEGGTIQGSHINSISTDQVRNLDIEYCSIAHLVANYIDADSIAANYASITDLEAIDIETESLKTNQAEILSLLSGNIGSELIQTIHLTADNVTIDDAVIKDLIASKISVSDLLAGNIDTRQIHIISSDDGSGITIADQTMQFKDADGNVRIQIGQDKSGNFSFILTGPNGSKLLTETGLQPDAIADNFIKNEMVDDKAISSRNIDWISTGATVDENGNPVWDVASMTMNGEEFNVTFNRLLQNVNNMSTTVENQYNELVNMIGNGSEYEIIVTSSNGTLFEGIETVTTTLSCSVLKRGIDITDDIPEANFSWKKYLDNGQEDTNWANLHVGTKTIHFVDEPIGKRAVFICEVDIPAESSDDNT